MPAHAPSGLVLHHEVGHFSKTPKSHFHKKFTEQQHWHGNEQSSVERDNPLTANPILGNLTGL